MNKQITRWRKHNWSASALRAAIEPLEIRAYLSFGPVLTTTDSATINGTGGTDNGNIYAGNFGGSSGSNDLAIDNGSNVQLLLSKGDGTFTTVQGPAVDSGTEQETPFVTGAFMGNSLDDIATLNQNATTNQSTISVYPDQGGGTFGSAVTTDIPETSSYGVLDTYGIDAAVAGDFNGDGKPDIAIEGTTAFGDQGLYSLLVFTNSGSGNFTESENLPISGSSAFDPTANNEMLVGDFNGDGNTDIVLLDNSGLDSTYGPHLDVFLGTGQGQFTQQSTSLDNSSGSPIDYEYMAEGDFNNDGNLDVALASSTSIVIYSGNGDGTFTAGSPIALTTPPTSLEAADFNGDNNLDLFTGNAILLGNGSGGFSAPVATSINITTLPGVALPSVDLNGDNRPDLAGPSTTGTNIVSSLNTGTYTPPVLTTVAITPSTTTATLGSSVTLSATVTPVSGSGTPTGTLTFLDGSTSLGTATLSGGTASISTTALLQGTNKIRVRFGGDSTFIASVSASINVSAAGPSDVALTSSNSSPNLHDEVYLTAEIGESTGSILPTGTMTFYSGSTVIGTATVGTNGDGYPDATLDTTALPAGTDSLTASYSGDANYQPSTSPPITVTVAPEPTSVISLDLSNAVLPAQVYTGEKFKATLPLILSNNGTKPLHGTYQIAFYASTSGEFDGTQILISQYSKTFSVGTIKPVTLKYPLSTLPSTLSANSYTILVKVIDPTGAIATTSSYSSIAVAAPFVSLSAVADDVVPATIAPGKTGSLTLLITNNGNIPTSGKYTIVVNPSPDGYTVLTDIFASVSVHLAVKAGATSKVKVKLKVPAGYTAGQYYAVATITQGSITTNTFTNDPFTVS